LDKAANFYDEEANRMALKKEDYDDNRIDNHQQNALDVPK